MSTKVLSKLDSEQAFKNKVFGEDPKTFCNLLGMISRLLFLAAGVYMLSNSQVSSALCDFESLRNFGLRTSCYFRHSSFLLTTV